MATISLTTVPAAAAHADAKVTWQNVENGNYLEVYQSSLSQGAMVGAWPWNGTKTQYWYDTYLGFGSYWSEQDYNAYSNGVDLILTAYNSCADGVTQWPTGLYTTQEWKEYDTGPEWMLINYGGCDGDAYHDELAPYSYSGYNVYLYEEGNGTQGSLIYWK